MITVDPRLRRRRVPTVDLLESRRLLSFSVTSAVQGGQDLVGPDASQGNDGIVDLQLSLSGLSNTSAVDHITLTSYSQSGVALPLEWATEPDPNGYALAEFFYSPPPISTTGDLFINPQIRKLAPQAGTGTPTSLGGSTGALPFGQLQNGDWLDVTVYYQDGSQAGTSFQLQQNSPYWSLTSPTDPMPTIPTPSPVVMNAFTITNDGQDHTGNLYEQGWVHLVVTATAFTFTRNDFANYNTSNGLVFTLSDDAGLSWDSLSTEQLHNHIDAILEGSGNTGNTVDLYFPPLRDELPVDGATAPNMTLQISVPGYPGVYLYQFTGQDWDLTKVASYVPSGTDTAVTSESQLDDDLANAAIGTIDLSPQVPNQIIYVNQPLQITHSIIINGNGDTIWFDQSDEYHSGGNTAAWPSTDDGAIFVNNPYDTHISITLNDFTIKFDTNVPIDWSNDSGNPGPTFDPEYNLWRYGSPRRAVIDTGDDNVNSNTQILTLNRVNVYGPPAFDSIAQSQGNTNVGEQAIDLIETDGGGGGFSDWGSITGGTFQGGSIDLWGGPWTVTGNTVLGGMSDTYSPSAFGFHSPHDVVLQGNTVTQSATDGTEFRLVNFAVSGYNNVVEDNSFGGGAGETGNDVTWDSYDQVWKGLNNPEVVLEENNDVLFEGRPAGISTDGRLVDLSNVRGAGGIGAGAVVSILSGVNGDGSPNMSQAGEWFRVAQQVSVTTGTNVNTIEFLMGDPLPAPPPGGYYVIEVTPSFVNDSFINNTINLANRTSIGLKIDSDTFGTRIIGNQVTFASVYNNVFPGVAMIIGADLNSGATDGDQPTASVPYPLPLDWTTMPDLSTLIEGNTFRDSLGIMIGVENGDGTAYAYWSGQNYSSPSTGRVYLTASVIGNTFEWDSSLLSSWASAFDSEFSQYDSRYGNDPAESSSFPTVTVGEKVSVEPPGEYGSPRYAWTVGGSNPHTGQPFFVDPTENVVDVGYNVAQTIGSDGSITPRAEPTGQVMSGIVGGSGVASTVLATTTSTGLPYFPFNVNDYPQDVGNSLNIYTGQTGSNFKNAAPSIQALMLGQDNYDLVGSGTGNPGGDGTQDLHIELIGLSPTATVSTVVVNGGGEQWQWPESQSPPSLQIVFDHPAGTSTADIFIQPTGSFLDGSFTIDVTYQNGNPIAIPVQGVLFNPLLPVLPTVPQAPVIIGAATMTSSVSLSWSPSAGATGYLIKRELHSSPGSWTTVNPDVTTPSYTDSSGLSSGTPYDYEVRAIVTDSNGNLLDDSPFSEMVTATTAAPAPQGDSLTPTMSTLSMTEGTPWSGTVATFTDTNSQAAASEFAAAINWGDGLSSSGTLASLGNGNFQVNASGTPHTYSAFGSFTVQVTIQMPSNSITVSTSGTANVSVPFTQVALQYNQVGITSLGSTAEGQIDGSNDSYSSNALGGTTITWDYATFTIGQSNQDNVVQATGQTITLNCTGCSAIEILGAATGGANQGGVFRVNYSDNSYDQDTLGFSDWTQGYNRAGTIAPGEATVIPAMPFYTYNGTTEILAAGSAYLYGYTIPVDPAKTLSGLVLPSGPNALNIKILAIDLIQQPAQVNLTSYYSQVGITSTGSSTSGRFNGVNSYSSTALGNTVTWNGNTFNMGPVNQADVVPAQGQFISLPPGHYSSIEFLGTAISLHNEAGVFKVIYSDYSETDVSLGFSDWLNGYDQGSTMNAPGETTVATMTSYETYSSSTHSNAPTSGNAYLYGYTIPVDPSKTVIQFGLANDQNIVILAMDLISQPPQVNMGSGSSSVRLPFNEIGISTPNSYNNIGTPATGIDGVGSTYSAAALGNTVSWNGQTFDIGPASVNDVLMLNGSSWLTLPAGNYTSLEILGASTFGHVETEQFMVHYVNNEGTDTFTQAFSDWKTGYNGTPGSTAPGESIALKMTTYNNTSGPQTGTVYLYGYSFPLDPTKTVQYLQIPNDNHMNILAIDEVYQPEQVNLGAGGTDSGIPIPANQAGISTVATASIFNMDGHGNTYSAAALGNTVSWNGQTFDIGPAGVNDMIETGGASVLLPEGNFTSLMLLGAATNEHYETGFFQVYYTDGSYDSFTQDFSDWRAGYNGTFGTTAPGESIALMMNTYNNTSSGVVNQKVDLYGYVLPLNPVKTVKYMAIDNNVNIKILAIDEVYQPEQVNLGDATNSLNPAFNAVGITMNGYTSVSGGGLDGNGDTYSAEPQPNGLGTTVTWNNQMFDLGPASEVVGNVVQGTASGSTTIPLPPGNYTSIQILGTATGVNPQSGVFSVDYARGGPDTFTLGLSDWQQGYTGPGTTAAWESQVFATPMSYNTPSGPGSGNVYLYGYVLATNPGQTVVDLVLPANSKIDILAIDVVDQPEQVNLGDATNSANPAFNWDGITMPGYAATYGGYDSQGVGIDNGGDTYAVSTQAAPGGLSSPLSWGGQSFTMGPASETYADVIAASGSPPIALPQGQYTSIEILAAAAYGAQSQPFYVDYANGGGTDTFTLGVSGWMGGYYGAGTTSAWESIAATMGDYNTQSANPSGTVYLYAYVLPVNPAKVVADLRAPNDNSIKILAIDAVDQPPQVNLGDVAGSASPPTNVIAITTNSQSNVTGGLDGSGDTYSATALATAVGSAATVTWNGQTFNLGAAGINDAVAASGQTLTLPQGYSTSIQMLGAATGGSAQALTMTVNYVGGGTSTFTQTFSDWKNGSIGPGTKATGETIVATMGSYNTPSGNQSGKVYLYGYVFPVDPTKLVASVTLSSNSSVKILAIDAVDQPPQVNLGNGTSSSNPPDNITALTFNSLTSVLGGGLDGSGDTYSANALATALNWPEAAAVVTWNSETFDLGPISVNDAVAAGGQTIPLPQGYFSSIRMLGTATGGTFQSLTVTVNYVGGGSSTFTQTFSDWQNGYTGGGTTAPGESIVAPMRSYNAPSPTGNVSGNVYLYGYTFSINSTQIVSSITLSSNSKVKILAIDEVAAANTDPASATLLSRDTATQGNWIGVYGSQGNDLVGDTPSIPSYATVAINGASNWLFTTSTTDPRALQNPGGSGRIADVWYSATSFTVDLDLTDGQAHNIALYFLDWDYWGRSEQVQISDVVTGTVLDTETVSSFARGVYLDWKISGDVVITFTNLANPNAVLSAIFFDPVAGPSASLVGRDTATQGNWIGAYGAQGNDLVGDTPSIPTYATVAINGASNWLFTTSTTDPRALQNPGGSGRIADVWYSATSFTVDLDLTDGQAHNIALYFLDWDFWGRSEQVQITNAATGTVLDTESVSSFARGLYLDWKISGDVVITFTNEGNPNAVLSGIFFDPDAVSPALQSAFRRSAVAGGPEVGGSPLPGDGGSRETSQAPLSPTPRALPSSGPDIVSMAVDAVTSAPVERLDPNLDRSISEFAAAMASPAAGPPTAPVALGPIDVPLTPVADSPHRRTAPRPPGSEARS